MNADGSNPTTLYTDRTSGDVGPGSNFGGVTWSPDGTQIAFVLHWEFRIMSADGTDVRRVPGTYAYRPAWQPIPMKPDRHTRSAVREHSRVRDPRAARSRPSTGVRPRIDGLRGGQTPLWVGNVKEGKGREEAALASPDALGIVRNLPAVSQAPQVTRQ
jgi:hypothetical protein